MKAICRSQLNFSDKQTTRVLISSEKGTISPPISSPAGNDGLSEVTKLKLPMSMTFVLAALHINPFIVAHSQTALARDRRY
ncbi:hypothetical protein TKK_0009857 [Trichogramma kaykai]